MRDRKIVLALLVALTAIASSPPISNAAPKIRGYVIGNGATPSVGIAGGGKRMHGTVGQAAVGVSTGSSLDLCHGFWCVVGSALVSVDPPPDGVDATRPKALGFGAPRPNPAWNAAHFAVDLPRVARIDLRVMDVQGRQVRIVESGSRGSGFHTIAWDGRDDAGMPVLAGVYYARLVVEGVVIGTRRVVMRR